MLYKIPYILVPHSLQATSDYLHISPLQDTKLVFTDFTVLITVPSLIKLFSVQNTGWEQATAWINPHTRKLHLFFLQLVKQNFSKQEIRNWMNMH